MMSRVIRWLRHLYHYLAYLAAGAVIVVCMVALTFKFWVMPNISSYSAMLEQAASDALGQSVQIGSLHADWSGFNPRVTLRDIRMTPATGESLALPRMDVLFSWLSLPLLEWRLASLSLERPQVFMHRDDHGVITLAGIPINVAGPPSPLPDWLLRQPRILIKDAEIVWRDDQLDAPELRLSGVRVLLENHFGRHRFGGIAYPTAAAARKLDIRGDLRGKSVQDLSTWSGEVYARVDGARFESWGRWVPWAQQSVRGGVGDIRFWLKLHQGKLLDLTGDARLEKIAINIDPALPNLVFDRLTGRAGWARKQDQHAFFVDRLRFKAPGAALSDPASLRVNLTPAKPGTEILTSAPINSFRRIAFEARNLRLEALTALTGALPLPKRGHDLIQALNPRGLIDQGAGHWSGAKDYAVKLRIRAAGMNPYARFPGLDGVSARIEANQAGGEARIDGRDLNLSLPQIFRHDLGFSQIDAHADWKLDAQGMTLNFAAERIVNPDLDGSVEGRLRFAANAPAQADISAHLRRGEASAVYRYVPRVVGENTYHWLQRSLVAGTADDVRLTLHGPLNRFPFHTGGGDFKVAINVRDGVLDFAPGWPRVEAINGKLTFQGMAMRMEADSGRILDTRLGPVKVMLRDLHDTWKEPLLIDGQVFGETRAFLDFIKQSPVHVLTGGFTEHFQAAGDGRLHLKLTIPLHHMEATSLAGHYQFDNNRLLPGSDLPELTDLNGSLEFTQGSFQAQAVRAQVLNLPAILSISSVTEPESGHRQVRVHLDGDIDAAAMRPHLPPALASRISGSTRWQADLALGQSTSAAGSTSASGNTGLTIRSELLGLNIDLPAPFGKKQDQPMRLHIVKELAQSQGAEPAPTDSDTWFARYGELMTLRAAMPRSAPARVHLRLGAGEASPPQDAGLSVSGTLRKLDLDAWRKIDFASSGTTSTLPLREASIAFNELRLFNRLLNDTHVKFRPSAAGWRIALAGREITGELTTIPSSSGTRVMANFKHLSLPERIPEAGQTADIQADLMSRQLTGVELKADRLVWQGRQLGELHLRMSPDRQGLRMDNFLLVNPDGRLSGKGMVANHPRRPTRLEFELESQKLDKLLERLGLPDRVKRGSLRMSGPLGWSGGLEAFDLAKLAGNLEVSLKQGQFVKIEPGAGKLLGILSLQALPRRIALDFRDVFTEGFAFDEISGNIHLERGAAYTNDLRMNGPAAKVRMSGVADLVQETQNLRVNIEPRLEDTLAVAGALLGGPAVGVGALIASKILQNPLGQATSFEYAITGAWADPVVTKLARPKVKSDAAE